MSPETRNLIAAMSLSLAILIGWQLYFVEPELEAQRAAYNEQAAQQSELPQPSGRQTGQSSGQLADQTATAALTDEGRRITISTATVSGSLSTMGARIDDILLTSYAETQDEGADNIHLMLPFTSPEPYIAEFGWVGAPSQQLYLPDANTVWQANSDILSPDSPLILRWDNGQGLAFTRAISINDDYLITVKDSVASTTDNAVQLSPYGLLRRTGTPQTDGLYILHEGPLGVFDETLSEQDYDDLVDAGNRGLSFDTETAGGWIGITDKYWLAALMPEQNQKVSFAMRALQGSPQRYQTDFLGQQQTLQPGAEISWTTYLFAGAKRVALLDRYSEELNIPNFDLAIDFGWFYFLTKPFFYGLSKLYDMLGNFGMAIIVFTIFVRLALFPLANKSYKSMGKMRELAPRIQKMREDFGDDKPRLQREMMALYKSENVNPAAGCLPIILQIPVFFALYKVLYVSIEMRHAPFYGWISDLSAVDPTSIFNLFGLLPYSVDFIPQFLSIGIWPILMGISMAVQMRLNPPPPDPVQAKIFQWMPVFFTFLLAGFPAGLVIYWTWNNTLSILQQWWITRNIKKTMGS